MPTVRSGDVVFKTNGQPNVFTGESTEKRKLVLDSDPKVVQNTVRHGYLNGLKSEEREKFNSILDDVKKNENPQERITVMQDKVRELEEEPVKNMNLIRYLNSEIAHAMNVLGVKPRYFHVDEYRVK